MRTKWRVVNIQLRQRSPFQEQNIAIAEKDKATKRRKLAWTFLSGS